MPSIPFPDVPDVPGVPPLNRVEIGIDYSDVVSVIASGNPIAFVESVLTPRWGIYKAQTLEKVIEPDSVVAFEYRGDARISDFPVERGGIRSYNKVVQPYDIRIKMTCGGVGTLTRMASSLAGQFVPGINAGMAREDFLTRLEEMRASLETYELVTPDYVYKSVNLVHFDYKRTNTDGVTLLTADLYLREIQQSATADYRTVATDSAADAQGLGTVSLIRLDASQNAAINRGGA